MLRYIFTLILITQVKFTSYCVHLLFSLCEEMLQTFSPPYIATQNGWNSTLRWEINKTTIMTSKKREKKQNVTNFCSAVGGQSGVYKNGFIFGYCGEDIIRDGPIKSLSTVRWPFVFFLGRLTNSWGTQSMQAAKGIESRRNLESFLFSCTCNDATVRFLWFYLDTNIYERYSAGSVWINFGLGNCYCMTHTSVGKHPTSLYYIPPSSKYKRLHSSSCCFRCM